MIVIPRNSHCRRHWPRLAQSIFWILAVLASVVFPDERSLCTSVLVMVLFAMSLDLIVGYAGIVTLGHSVFFGIGAYAAALLSTYGWHEALSGALIAGCIAGLMALLCGPFVLRFRGLPLIMMTFALNAVAYEAANQATSITGGDDGLTSFTFNPILGRFDWTISGETQFFYALAVLFALFVLMRLVVNSPFGLALKGIRENRERMRLVGAPMMGQIVVAYGLSGCMAGIAGAIACQTTGFVGLGTLSPEASIDVLVMLAIGGIGDLYGAFIGVPLYMIVRHTASDWNPYHWLFFMGVLLIAVRYSNGGLLGLLKARRTQ
jgi:branched-chain amino acid transport system permease protein